MDNNNDNRQRIDQAMERVIRTEGRQDGHELLCAQRYNDIIEKIGTTNEYIKNISKVGTFLALLLFGLELGRVTWPALFDAILRHAQ